MLKLNSQQIIDNSCLRFGDISAKDWGNYSFNGEDCQTHINILGGMGKIVDNLGKLLEKNIELNKTVDKISDWNSDGEEIKLLCNDGCKYR